MKTFQVQEESKIRLHGRYDRECGRFFMDWTGSGIEFCFRGTLAELQLFADTAGKDQWILIEVDGTPSSRIRLSQGIHWYTAIDSRSKDPDPSLIQTAIRRVRILKESQAHTGEENAVVACNQVRIDGELCDLPRRPRIECIGDSLTSGEGVLSPHLEDIGSDISIEEWTSSYYSWTGYLSRLLNLDIQVVSQGGWGVVCGWNNDPRMNIPSIYEKVCGLIAEPFAGQRGASKEYDFAFDPDMIIINLGTNDKGAFYQPPWRDPTDGTIHKMHRVAEDSNPDSMEFVKEDQDMFIAAAIRFIRILTKRNPRARILWTYGMMSHELWPAIELVKSTLLEQDGVVIDTLLLPIAAPDELGANSHPLASYHESSARHIAEYIRPFL